MAAWTSFAARSFWETGSTARNAAKSNGGPTSGASQTRPTKTTAAHASITVTKPARASRGLHSWIRPPAHARTSTPPASNRIAGVSQSCQPFMPPATIDGSHSPIAPAAIRSDRSSARMFLRHSHTTICAVPNPYASQTPRNSTGPMRS